MKFPDTPESPVKVEVEMTRDELESLISDFEGSVFYTASKEFIAYLKRLR